MQDALRSPLVTYNSLQDEHLAEYFSSPHRRRHLRRMGLITRDGTIVDEITIQRRAAYKEHRKRHKDAVATNAVLRANEIEKKRRAEIKNKLEDLAKYERAQKIKMQRLHPLGVQTLRPGHTHSVASTSASAQSHLSQVLKTHRDRMEFDPDQLRELKQLVQKITGPRMVSPTPGRPVPRPPTTPKPQTPAATKVGRDRAARRRPQTAPTRSQNSPMERPGEAKVQTHSNVMLRIQYLGTNFHLKRGKKEDRKRRVKQQKEGETKGGRGQGRGRGGEKEEDITSTEVVVLQQHCSRPVYKGTNRPGDCFTFYSLRHIGMPFALTLYLGGMIDHRVSVCCEYRHRPGALLGGKSAHFKVVSVEGGTPCYQCQAKRSTRCQVRPKQANMEPTLPEHEGPPQHLPSEWPSPPPPLSSASRVESVPPSSYPFEGAGREEDLGSPHSSVYSPSFHSESQDSSSDEETVSDVDSEHSMHSPSEEARPLSASQMSHSRGFEGGTDDRISESGRSSTSQRSQRRRTSQMSSTAGRASAEDGSVSSGARGLDSQAARAAGTVGDSELLGDVRREGDDTMSQDDHREQSSPLTPSEDQTLPQEEHTRGSRETKHPSKPEEASESATDAREEPHSDTNVVPQTTPTQEEPATLSSHGESNLPPTPPDQPPQPTDTSPPPTLRTSGGVTIVYALGPVSTSETGTQTEEDAEEASEPSDILEGQFSRNISGSKSKQELYSSQLAQQQSGETMESERGGKEGGEGEEKEGEMEVEKREGKGEVEGAVGEDGEKGEGGRGGEKNGDEVKEKEGEPGEKEEEEENREGTTTEEREEERREEEEGEEEGEGVDKKGRFEMKQPQTGEQVQVDHRASQQTVTQQEEATHANQDLTNEIRSEPKAERETPSPSPVTELQSLGVSAIPTTHDPALPHPEQLHTAIPEHPPHDTSSQDGATTSAATYSPSPLSTSPRMKPSIPLDTHKLIPSSGKLPPTSSDVPHSDGQSQSSTSIQDTQEEQPTVVHPASLVVAEEASCEQSQSEHVKEKQRSVGSLEKVREQSQMGTSTPKSPEEQEDTSAVTQPNEPNSVTVVSKQNTKADDFHKTTDLEHKTREDEDLTPSGGGQETSHSSTLPDHSLQPSGYINMPGTSEPGSKSESLVQVSEEEFSGSILSQSSTGPESLSSSHSGSQLETRLDSKTHPQRSTVMEDAAATMQETGTTVTSNRGGGQSSSVTQEEGVDSKLETHPEVLDSQ